MAPATATTIPSKPKPRPKVKEEKLFHPHSRKAGQLERKQLRKAKLTEQASKKAKKESAKSVYSTTD